MSHHPSATSHSPAFTIGNDPTPPSLPVPLDPGTENAIAVKESDPLNQAGDFLGGSRAVRDDSHLVGTILS